MNAYKTLGIYFGISCLAYVANAFFTNFFFSLLVVLMPFDYSGQNQSNLVIVLFATATFPALFLPVNRIPGFIIPEKIKQFHWGHMICAGVIFLVIWMGCFVVALTPAPLLRYDLFFMGLIASVFMCMHMLSSLIFFKIKELY